jgi:hypothetical protein
MGTIRGILFLLLLPMIASANVEVIYTWSTMMPLSIEGIKDAQAVCDKHAFQCTFVLDPFEPKEWLDSELLIYVHTQTLSDQLIERGILNHFPAIAVIKDGNIMGNIHLGYLEPHMLETIILRRLQ